MPATDFSVFDEKGHCFMDISQEKIDKFLLEGIWKEITSQEVERLVLSLKGEMKGTQIQEILELKNWVSFLKNYFQPAIIEGFIELTIPQKPKSSKQSYRLTEKGWNYK